MTDIQAGAGAGLYPLHTAPLAILDAVLDTPHKLGITPAGERKCVPVLGGSIKGERLSGRVLPGGSDWAVSKAGNPSAGRAPADRDS